MRLKYAFSSDSVYCFDASFCKQEPSSSRSYVTYTACKESGLPYLIVFRWEPRERIRSFIFSGMTGNFTLAQFVIGVQLGYNIVNAIFVWS